MKKILVIGSMNMDLVVKMERIPHVGETVTGKSFFYIPGGKGANQGVAIAKLGKEVVFLGKTGKDSYGDMLKGSMEKSGVDISHIETSSSPTGIALIQVDEEGNNNIVVVPGANGQVDRAYLDRHREVFDQVDMVVMQLEIPLDTVDYALSLAKERNILTILNPAPACLLPETLLSKVDLLIPNEYELAEITGVSTETEAGIKKGASMLLKEGVKRVLVTLGEKGVQAFGKNMEKICPAYSVEVVDTTAAGDSFIGGFCTSFVEKEDLDLAILWGQATASLAIGCIGAQSSLPNFEEVISFIQARKLD